MSELHAPDVAAWLDALLDAPKFRVEEPENGLVLDDLVSMLAAQLGGEPEVHRNAPRCDRVGIVTGAGSYTKWVEEARALGCDTFVTGEGSMYTRLYAKEVHVNLVLADHYRTEAPGIRTLAERCASQFALDWAFIEDQPIG